MIPTEENGIESGTLNITEYKNLSGLQSISQEGCRNKY